MLVYMLRRCYLNKRTIAVLVVLAFIIIAIAKFKTGVNLIYDSEISLMIKGADSSGAISLVQLNPASITVSSPKTNVSNSSVVVKSSRAESSPESDTKSLQSSQQDVSIAVSSLKIIDTTKPLSAKNTKTSSEVVVIQTKNVTDNDTNRNGVLVTVTRPTSPETAGTIDSDLSHGWDSGSFCDDLLHNTFSEIVPVCAATDQNEQSPVTCKRNPNSTKMIECSMRNVLIWPKKLFNGLAAKHIVNSGGIAILLTNDSVSCKSPNMTAVFRTAKTDDHTRMMVEESVRRPPTFKPSHCQRWIDEPTFFYQGQNFHIYFEFLSWYNVYKSILDQGNIGTYKVIRFAAFRFRYLFGDYEKLLFPGIEFVENIKEQSICFKKLILPPRGYSSMLFRCKMESNILSPCFHCDGKGRPGTAFRSFRTYTLKVCSLSDSHISGYRNPKKIVIILRKKYIRHPGANPKKVPRVLSNGNELIAEIKARFKTANVTSFYGEDLSVCDQIRNVYDADIYIGVHGAGLVHSWWLQENAMLFEIEPSDKMDNPTFRMLTTLVGIHYKGFPIDQRSVSKIITVDVKNVVNTLEATIKNGV